MVTLSIITINYNNAAGLAKTIESVLSQDLRECEFIIVDGNSTDNSNEIIKNNEAQITKWISENDKGPYDAMNKGVLLSSGRYCLFMNSGDTFYNENVLSRVLPMLDNADVITGDVWLSFGRKVPAPQYVTMGFLYAQTLCHQSSFIKRSLLVAFPYDINLRYVADWKFWIETIIFKNSTYQCINELIANYDWNGMSTVNYTEVSEERKNVLLALFPERVLSDYEKLVVGRNWEEKLYIEMQNSKHHRVFYKINVFLIKAVAWFKRGTSWIDKYPLNNLN